MSTLRVAAIKDLTGNTGFVLSSSTVTTNNTLVVPGTLQINGSITGSTNSILPSHSGQNGKMLYTNGSAPYWDNPPSADNISSMSVFTSSGTWNRPSDVKYIKVQVIGGGGAGGFRSSRHFIGRLGPATARRFFQHASGPHPGIICPAERAVRHRMGRRPRVGRCERG